MKRLSLKTLDNRERLQVLNHLFFITAFLFVANHNVLQVRPGPVAEAPLLAQTLNYLPRTPPPGMDPDQMSGEEIDLSVRPDMFSHELRIQPPTGLIADTPSTGLHTPTGTTEPVRPFLDNPSGERFQITRER